jgi:hypothetical protein
VESGFPCPLAIRTTFMRKMILALLAEILGNKPFATRQADTTAVEAVRDLAYMNHRLPFAGHPDAIGDHRIVRFPLCLRVGRPVQPCKALCF